MNTDVQLDVVQMIFHLPVESRESILCVNLCFCSSQSHIALASQLLSNGTCISLNYSTVSFSTTYYGISLRQCGRYRRELLHHNAFRALLYLAASKQRSVLDVQILIYLKYIYHVVVSQLQ